MHTTLSYRPVPLPCVAMMAVVLAGCRVGGLDTHDIITRQPAGILVLLELEHGNLLGELLEVRNEGILLRADTLSSTVSVGGAIVLVPEADIPREFRAGTSWPSGGEQGRAVEIRREDDQRWLRGLSRFPYGMTPEVQQRLLAIHGQSDVARLAPHRSSAGEVAVDAFVEEVAMAVAPFEDRANAIRHGYRRVGPDFPGMGEHWVNTGLILSGEVDPSQPQVLTYIEVGGAVHLTGAAFAIPLLTGEAPPAAPLGPHVWHDHGASLDEEALVLESPSSMDHEPGGPRLAMFHIWLWPDNPDGPTAQNNWGLAWARLGLRVPDRPDPIVARALSLAGGDGGEYYRLLLARAGGLEPHQTEDTATIRVIDLAVGGATRDVSRILSVRADARALEPQDLHELRAVWTRLWSDIRQGIDDDAWLRFRPAFEAWGSP